VSSRRTVHTYRQQAPTPERYQEIQQALASKGFFQGQVNGQWGPDSIDALKRFQTSQNLMPDGKINSLSLIGLGLGPKRLTAKSDTAPRPPGTPPPAPATPQQ
jgi:peptidoglycan hydrolase-like protein with peptidoglycan-binding domain